MRVSASGTAARGLGGGVETEEEWGRVRELVVAICQQRLRMR